MSTDTPVTETEDTAADASAGEPAGGSFVEETPGAAAETSDAHVQTPEFSPLKAVAGSGSPAGIGRFYDVDVTVWAELGRLNIPLRELMKLGEGSVVELGRAVSEPIDLMAQGVRVARGEVVVVDDCFALRIKEIESKSESD